MKNIISKIKKWYYGKYVPPDNDPNSVVIFLGHMEQPFLAKVLKLIGDFWLRHWQWILGIFITIAGLIVAIIKLGER